MTKAQILRKQAEDLLKQAESLETAKSDFKVGKWVTITGSPSKSNTSAGGVKPSKAGFRYPITGRIERTNQQSRGSIGLLICGAGFGLNTLLEEGKVRVASAFEIEKALTKEYLDKDYVGSKIVIMRAKNKGCVSDHVMTSTGLKYIPSEDRLTCNKYTVYMAGKWAEMTDDSVEIHGTAMEYDGDEVKFGCKVKDADCVVDLHDTIDAFNDESGCKVTAVVIDGSYTVTTDQLDAIYDAID
jgi:hypothetical protein